MGGIGSTIMGIALMIGMLVTPYAETAFGHPGRRSFFLTRKETKTGGKRGFDWQWFQHHRYELKL